MHLRKVRSHEEIRECVQMYIELNDDSFFPSDSLESERQFIKTVKDGRFIRVIEHHEKIIGWIYADIVKLNHVAFSVFQQMYYVSNCKGTAAYNAVKCAHQGMLEEAERLGLTYAISSCSHVDEDQVLVRILEKNGWKRKGHVAVKELTAKNPRVILALGRSGHLAISDRDKYLVRVVDT